MKLIKHEGYWIVLSDEKPRDKEWCLASYGPKNDKDNYIAYADNIHLGNVEHGEALLFSYNNFTHEIGYCKKILFSQNPEHNLPTINFSDEVIVEWGKKLGIVDVEKLALTDFKENHDGFISYKDRTEGYKNGYNQCLLDNADKIFTLEDILLIINEIGFVKTTPDELNSKEYQPFITDEDEQVWTINKEHLLKYTQYLTKEEYFCELDMEEIFYSSNMPKEGEQRPPYRPKITNNSCKVIKIWK